jgi:hypothetical protein
MGQELMENRSIEDSCLPDIEQKAEKAEIAGELFAEINEVITLLVASINTDQ